jgi:triphosphatase
VTAGGPREIELKLDVDPPAAATVAAELAEHFGEAKATTLTSVYYDTPDQELRAKGVTLRVRTGAGAPVQTVKRSASMTAGLFDRDEWESTLDQEQPDFGAFAHTPAGLDLAVDPARLAPIFETVVERSVWHAISPDSDIELALDKGLAAARGRTEEFAELELELRRGKPQHLFALLRRLKPKGRLRPGVETKSERGYKLAEDRVSRAHKAEALHLTRRMSTASAFQAVVHACLRHFWLNEPLLVATRAPEALHQTRVALRRLRSALSLFKPVVADRDYERLKRELQDVSRHLGEARNLDVYIKTAARPDVDSHPNEPGGAQFLAAIEDRRAKAYDEVLERLRSGSFRDTMMELLAWTEAGPWLAEDDEARQVRREMPVRTFAAAVLEKRRRRVKRRGRHLDMLDPTARHRVRIEAKKLRYASEFFASLAKSDKARHRQSDFTDALERLQEHLGDLNDIATGHQIAETFASHEPSLDSGLTTAVEVTGQLHKNVERLLADAVDAHARFVTTRRFWSSWAR